jgi:hypothetical protein
VWKDTMLSHLQALPKDAKAVTLWKNRDQAFVTIVDCLGKLIQNPTEVYTQNEKKTRQTAVAPPGGPLLERLKNSYVPRSKRQTKNNVKTSRLALSRRPERFVSRVEEFKQLKSMVLAKPSAHSRPVIAVRGQAGIGKTVLVGEVASDPDVYAAYSDGVTWLSLGINPKSALGLLKELGTALGDDKGDYSTEVLAESSVCEFLRRKAVLIILDDIVNLRDLRLFLKPFAPPERDALHSRLLFTTRIKSLALAANAEEFVVGLLSPHESQLILAEWLPNTESFQSDAAVSVFHHCDGHVLALRQVGSLLAQKVSDFGEDDGWKTVSRQLADERKLPKSPGLEEPEIDSVMETSISGLASVTDRDRYLSLAVLSLYWAAAEADAKQTVSAWMNLCLAENARDSLLKLHGLQLTYIKSNCHSTKEFHRILVE